MARPDAFACLQDFLTVKLHELLLISKSLNCASVGHTVRDDLLCELEFRVLIFRSAKKNDHLDRIGCDHNGNGTKHRKRHLPAVGEGNDETSDQGTHRSSFVRDAFAQVGDTVSPQLEGLCKLARCVLRVIVETNLLSKNRREDRLTHPLRHGLAENGKAAQGKAAANEVAQTNHNKDDAKLLELLLHFLFGLEESVHRVDQDHGNDRHAGTVTKSTDDARDVISPLRLVESHEATPWHLEALHNLLLALFLQFRLCLFLFVLFTAIRDLLHKGLVFFLCYLLLLLFFGVFLTAFGRLRGVLCCSQCGVCPVQFHQLVVIAFF
mmetsp:Transcript_77003/g.135773  ORF Transcript_77003/g.135773 Transcript_77003/m.135773 type:complete len:323 (-) Transcript_77003:2041-3009(-)